jgi:hypothetical protein
MLLPGRVVPGRATAVVIAVDAGEKAAADRDVELMAAEAVVAEPVAEEEMDNN